MAIRRRPSVAFEVHGSQAMKKTILVVDDSASVRQVARLTLVEAGFEVLEAVDGLDALQKLKAHTGPRISLILCDVNMPKLDGLTFSGEAKKLQDYRFTPIVICTTEGQQALRDQGKAIGVKAWMVKPFQPPQLLAVIGKLVPA